MPIVPYKGPGGGGRGGGIYYPDPPLIFTGATLTACRTARDAYFNAVANAAELVKFQGDQFRAIILAPTGVAATTWTYLTGNHGKAYDSSQWIDRGSAAVTDAYIDSRIATPGRANNPSGRWADSRIPSSVMRTSQFTAAAVLQRVGLTAAEVSSIVLGAAVDGNGGARKVVVTKKDGSTIDLELPQDGVPSDYSFSTDGGQSVIEITLGADKHSLVTDLPKSLLAIESIRTLWHYGEDRPDLPDVSNTTPVANPPTGWSFTQDLTPTANEWSLEVVFYQAGDAGVRVRIRGDIQLRRVHSSGPPPVHTGQFYVAMSATADITAIPAGANSYDVANGQLVEVPNNLSGSNGYIVMIQPAAADDITSMVRQGTDRIGAFNKASATFVDSGVTYEYWRTNREQIGSSTPGSQYTISRG